jgi:hypothetical protein
MVDLQPMSLIVEAMRCSEYELSGYDDAGAQIVLAARSFDSKCNDGARFML